MEEGNLPVVIGAFELLPDPSNLLGIGIGGLQCKETNALLRGLKGVVELAVHVEQLVEALVSRIVITKRGVELDAAVEQRLVRNLELLTKVLSSLSPVEVVSDGNHQLERESRVQFRH